MNFPSAMTRSPLTPPPSFWLEDCGDDLTPRPSLQENLTADVAILGGGYSGLWTAYFLLKAQPSLDVVIVEKEICGYGASGRNGGWCSPRFPVDAHALKRRYGVQTARDTLAALLSTVDEIGQVCQEENIDAHYRKNGLLSIARNAAQMEALRSACQTNIDLRLNDGSRMLSAEEAFERVHATAIVGGLFSDVGAAVHPGRLVRGLARTVEKMGARIFEQTKVEAVHEGAAPSLSSVGHEIKAGTAIVIANEAYRTGLAERRRDLLPMSSMIVLTEPLSDDIWRQIGWAGGESLSSPAHMKNYLTRTKDGRIVYGSRGAPYLFGSAIPESANSDVRMFATMQQTVREWWPALEDTQFTHAWGGYLGVPRDWMPTVNFDGDRKLGTLGGYTGRGVSTSALCGRTLAGLITGMPTGLEHLPFHRASSPKWEPEPFRWVGVRYVQNAFDRMDQSETAGRSGPFDRRFAKWLGEQ